MFQPNSACSRNGGIMAKTKWDKTDVIKAVQEAVSPGLSKPGGQKPGGLQRILDTAKKIPGKLGVGEQKV